MSRTDALNLTLKLSLEFHYNDYMSKTNSSLPVIVIPAFNREEALGELLRSINKASYPAGDVKLIISLEHQASTGVIHIAQRFQFHHGTVEIIKRKEKMGVREHLLTCGNYARKYGSVIVLEDDLIVAPDFYTFACQALNFYREDDNIGGISLYSQRFNETAGLPFEPLQSKWPVYFMKLTSSLGQCWTSRQWNLFSNWLHENKGKIMNKKRELPENMKDWPESSWKVLFNIFLGDTNRFFVYPYISYTTNNSHYGGAHANGVGNLFQVPVSFLSTYNRNLAIPSFNEQPVKYDMFMEITGEMVWKLTEKRADELEVDLYGTKPLKLLRRKPFAITSKIGGDVQYSYPLRLKPLEMNLNLKSSSKNDDFFSLIKTNKKMHLKNNSANRYMKMAGHFSHQNITPRRFLLAYLQDVFSRF